MARALSPVEKTMLLPFEGREMFGQSSGLDSKELEFSTFDRKAKHSQKASTGYLVEGTRPHRIYHFQLKEVKDERLGINGIV